MNDPHVEWLEYRLTTASDLEFRDPPPIEVDWPAFRAVLNDGVLRCSTKEHFATGEEAREVIEPFLRSWELYSKLTHPGRFTFAFAHAHVVDRSPPAPGERVIHAAAGLVLAGATVTATVTVSRRSYPLPPSTFLATESTQRMWQRLEEYRSNLNLLTHMANFCLTEIERTFSEPSNTRRRTAAKALNVQREVLDKLGFLAGQVGDLDSTARKAHVKHPRPHTPAERRWMEEAVRLLILRAGERAAAPRARLPLVAMADLPVLEES